MNEHISPILTLEDAQAAWDIFFGRFVSSELPLGMPVVFDPKIRTFQPRENRLLQLNAQDQTTFHHSDDFDDFLNGNTVRIPDHVILTQEKLDQVKEHIDKGSVSFSEIDHIYCALWLFKQNKISRQQMSTILAFFQVADKKEFKILDSDGDFTDEALIFLIPTLNRTAYGDNLFYGRLDQEQLERFRLLVLAAPKSEQVFCLASPTNKTSYQSATLKQALARAKSWNSMEVGDGVKDLHCSFGVIEAMQIALVGIHAAAACRVFLGDIILDVILRGVTYNFRPTAIMIPESGIQLKTNEIHGYKDNEMSVITAHDIYHAKLHNLIPPEFHLLLNHMGVIISDHTKQKWSKFLWKIIDREFVIFYNALGHNITLTEENGAIFFEKVFPYDKNLFPLIYDQLSDEAIAVIYNMIKEEELWNNLFKINIRELNNPYQFYIKKMEDFLRDNKDDLTPSLLNLKFRFYCACSHQEHYPYILNLVKDSDLEKNLHFEKIKYQPYKNHPILTFTESSGEQHAVDSVNVIQLIPALIRRKFSEGHDIDRALIVDQKRKIRAYFKSDADIVDALDEALTHFNSLEEKLQFLESCHTLMMTVKTYVHKNPNFDLFFSSMRDPLTKSQQKHKNDINEKIIEVIHEYANGMTQDEKKEFAWCLRKRKPLVSIYQNVFAEKLRPRVDHYASPYHHR